MKNRSAHTVTSPLAELTSPVAPNAMLFCAAIDTKPAPLLIGALITADVPAAPNEFNEIAAAQSAVIDPPSRRTPAELPVEVPVRFKPRSPTMIVPDDSIDARSASVLPEFPCRFIEPPAVTHTVEPDCSSIAESPVACVCELIVNVPSATRVTDASFATKPDPVTLLPLIVRFPVP